MSDPQKLPSAILEQLEQAEQLKIAGKHVEALAILESLLVEDPTNVAALEEVADNELSIEHYDRAERAAKRALQFDTKSYTGYYILGFIRSHERAWTESIDLLQKANKLKANNPEILRCLGWALFNGGQGPQGIVTLERALNLDPESTLTLCDLGVAYLDMHHITKAKALFLRALDLDPLNLRAKECLHAAERMETLLQSTTPAQGTTALPSYD